MTLQDEFVLTTSAEGVDYFYACDRLGDPCGHEHPTLGGAVQCAGMEGVVWSHSDTGDQPWNLVWAREPQGEKPWYKTACRKVAITIVRGIPSRELSEFGGVDFGGVLSLPKGVTMDDLPALYREWAEAHRPEGDFTDWLLKRGFTEDKVGFVHLFDEE